MVHRNADDVFSVNQMRNILEQTRQVPRLRTRRRGQIRGSSGQRSRSELRLISDLSMRSMAPRTDGTMLDGTAEGQRTGGPVLPFKGPSDAIFEVNCVQTVFPLKPATSLVREQRVRDSGYNRDRWGEVFLLTAGGLISVRRLALTPHRRTPLRRSRLFDSQGDERTWPGGPAMRRGRRSKRLRH